MQNLTLGIRDLNNYEANLIRVLLRVMNQENGFLWTFASEEPFDAFVVDTKGKLGNGNQQPPDIEIGLTNFPATSIRINRPIDRHRLQTCLYTLQETLESSEESTILKQEQAHLPQVAQSNDQMKPIALSTEDDVDDVKYKIIRWPNHAVIRNNKDRLRLSNLLVKREMSIGELSITSGVSYDECQSFVVILKSLQNVAISTKDLNRRSTIVESGKKQSQHINSISLGIISSIRRKLGL